MRACACRLFNYDNTFVAAGAARAEPYFCNSRDIFSPSFEDIFADPPRQQQQQQQQSSVTEMCILSDPSGYL